MKFESLESYFLELRVEKGFKTRRCNSNTWNFKSSPLEEFQISEFVSLIESPMLGMFEIPTFYWTSF